MFALVRVRLSVRLRRPADRGAARRRDRRARCALRCALSRKPVLYRRTDRPALIHAEPAHRDAAATAASACARARHAESFAREDFLAGPSNDGGAQPDRALARLADRALALVGPEGRGQEPSWRRSGPTCGRAARLRARARRADLPAALATGALVVEDLAEGASTSARCFICSIWRARRRPSCCSRRAPRRQLARRAARSRLAVARAAGGDAARAGRCPVARA